MNVKKNHSFQSFSTAVIIIIIINSCNLIRLVKRESRFHYTDRKYCAFIRRRNWNEKKKKEKTRLLANCNYFWTLLLLLTRYNTIETIYDFHRNSSSKVAGRNKNTFDFVTELSSHLVWSLSTYFTYGWIARPSRRASKYVSRGVVEKKKKREKRKGR